MNELLLERFREYKIQYKKQKNQKNGNFRREEIKRLNPKKRVIERG